MQDSSLLRKLNRALTGRFIKFLAELSEKDPEAYAKVYAAHHRFLKEGAITDYDHRDGLSKLLRFESSATAKDQTTSLTEYVKRMKEGQTEIYHLTAATREAAEASPYFEAFRELGYEVLFSFEPVDEFVFNHLNEFDGKPLKPAEKADLKIETQTGGLSEDDAKQLSEFVKSTLGDRVGEVSSSKRLVGSPAVVVDADEMTTATMRRLMRAMKQDNTSGAVKVNLELNPRHPVVIGLSGLRTSDAALAAKVAEQLFDSARLTAGLLENPHTLLQRMNELLERVVAAPPKS
jgi:molecular chaperone HtpG